MSHAVFSGNDSTVSTLNLVKNFEGWDSRYLATKFAKRLQFLVPEMVFFVVDDEDTIIWSQKPTSA